jgi:hypothetical protein
MATRGKPTKYSTHPDWRRRFLLRPKIWAGMALVAALGLGGHQVWRQQAPTIAQEARYQLNVDDVRISPQPPWIRSDVKSEALRDAGLPGTLSLLDDWDALVERVRQAFEFHPWIASVKRITRRLPSSLEIELEYRRPLAAVQSAGPGGAALLPVDAMAVRLPEADLTPAELRYLPRISGIAGRPIVGHAWEDPRVIGGVRLAAALADVWQQLQLVEIVPSPHPVVQGESRFYSYELLTSGRTRIVWGAAPGEEQAAGESALQAKRKRVLDYAATIGRLDSIDGPPSIDVRKEMIVAPRTTQRESAETR